MAAPYMRYLALWVWAMSLAFALLSSLPIAPLSVSLASWALPLKSDLMLASFNWHTDKTTLRIIRALIGVAFAIPIGLLIGEKLWKRQIKRETGLSPQELNQEGPNRCMGPVVSYDSTRWPLLIILSISALAMMSVAGDPIGDLIALDFGMELICWLLGALTLILLGALGLRRRRPRDPKPPNTPPER